MTTEVPAEAYEAAWQAFRTAAVGPALGDEDGLVAAVVDAAAPVLFQAGRRSAVEAVRGKLEAAIEREAHAGTGLDQGLHVAMLLVDNYVGGGDV